MLNVNRKNGIMVVEIDRPPLNVLSIELLKELRAAFRETAASDARALLIRGAGKCFSAGADVSEHLPGVVETMLPLFTTTLQDLMALDIPTAAYVHDATLGGGFELALACDFLLADEKARLGVPEITLGVFPPAAAAILPMELGSRRAMELILSGELLSAAEAHRIGLVNRIVSREDAEAFVEKIARHPRSALVACKKAARLGDADRLKIAERIYLNELMSHAEPVEGLRAFLEKRPPAWAAGKKVKA